MNTADPLTRYATIEDTLYQQAISNGEAARDRLSKNDLPGAVARYEAACTRLIAARELAKANVQTAGQLAEEAYREMAENAKEHLWPIEGLEREPGQMNSPTPFPHWGVDTTDGGNGDARVSLVASAHDDRPKPMLLRVVSEDVHGLNHEATAQVTLPQLRALLALAERIDAGLAVPFDQAGNYRVLP